MLKVCEIVEVISAQELEQVRILFTEYRAELAVDACLQSFHSEIAELPGTYAPPWGKLLLAKVVGQPVGCVGLRTFPVENTCEMKRLYVRPPFRGDKIGLALAQKIVETARTMGYRSMRLDSHPATMRGAVKMYRRMGFAEVPADPLKPIEGLIYMQLALA